MQQGCCIRHIIGRVRKQFEFDKYSCRLCAECVKKVRNSNYLDFDTVCCAVVMDGMSLGPYANPIKYDYTLGNNLIYNKLHDMGYLKRKFQRKKAIWSDEYTMTVHTHPSSQYINFIPNGSWLKTNRSYRLGEPQDFDLSEITMDTLSVSLEKNIDNMFWDNN